ncbi:hypothetical protein AVEN_245528-1 [Araneus ventricosus]|uniref:Uncharacterized protein n=1 Tax=Araneus ventricosus TaxID=182803 RepID=A0A4Y2JWB3_ARAVE|nr:hypothetical protein AVEN_245528-1 [Araneus ventricosus]
MLVHLKDNFCTLCRLFYPHFEFSIHPIVHVVRMKPYYDPDMQKDCLEDSPRIIQDTNSPRVEPESTSEEKRMTYTGPTIRSRGKLAS